MLGLKRGTVRLASYCPEWTKLFEEEEAHLLSLIGDLVVDIQHIGSTSIPGMPAKPIIDIGVGLKKAENTSSCIRQMTEAGYDFRGQSGPGTFLFAKGAEEDRTHYIHFVLWNSEEWDDCIQFRDYLSLHPEEAEEYADLKKALAEQCQGDRRQYTPKKADFIQEILRKSRQEFADRSNNGQDRESRPHNSKGQA